MQDYSRMFTYQDEKSNKFRTDITLFSERKKVKRLCGRLAPGVEAKIKGDACFVRGGV